LALLSMVAGFIASLIDYRSSFSTIPSASAMSGPPMATSCRHPGRSAFLKAQITARPSVRARSAASGRARGPPARSRTDGGRRCWPPREEHPTWAPDGRFWSPSGPIRVDQSPESSPSVCPSEQRSLWSGLRAASEVQGRRRSPRRCWPPRARAPYVANA